jgi:RNA polymerase-binding transcription factor DksA
MFRRKLFFKELKEKLEKEKASIEEALLGFAKKDKKLAGDWDVSFPEFNGGHLEEAADEVEEYETLRPIEFSLETRLKDINLALEKIKKGEYGKCERCQKPIPIERLKVYPEARTCQKCR